jgi:hypothetical protein
MIDYFVISGFFVLKDAIGSHGCLQSIQQWVAEPMASAQGCDWIARLLVWLNQHGWCG